MPLLLQARSLDTIFGIVAAIFLVSVTLLAVYLVYLFRTRNSDKPRRDDSKRKD
jgi:ABC-type Na+ efflux pump permease subunit